MKKKLSLFVMAVVFAFTAGFAVACSEVTIPKDGDKQYTVTYYYNYDGAPNGGVYKTETVDENTAAQKPAAPKRTNYTFDTWTTDTAGKVEYVFSTTVTGNFNLYAQWKKKSEQAATLTGITATVSKTYKVGDTFSKSDITVTAKYSDNTEKTVTDFTYTEPDMTTAGKKEITVTHSGKTANVEITVAAQTRKLTGIEIVTEPKKVYLVGEELDLTGMVVKAVYSNGDKVELTTADYEVSGYVKTELGDQEITVTYGTKTAKFTVTVNAAAVERIEITTAPSVTEYYVGEDIELDDMVVTAFYEDGTSDVVTNYTHNYNANKIGDQTVTISFGGKTANIAVKVIDVELIAIKVTKPTKTAYEVGEDLDLTGMVVTARYNNDTQKPLTAKEYKVEDDYISSKAGTYTVTVSYGGFEDEFKVTVTQVTYTVKFVTDVDGITADSQIVNKNGNAKTPTLNKENVGYRLLGWFESGSSTAYKFATTPVTKDITLTAKWQAIEYTVTYHLEGEIDGETVAATISGEKTKYTIESDAFTLVKPTVTTAGVKFLRWHKGSATGAAISQVAKGTTGNIDVYAEYTKNDTVTFVFDFNHDDLTEEHDVVSGLTVTQIDNPTRLGYNFGGWYNEAACTTEYDFDKPVTADLSVADRTIYAKWTPKTIEVVFDADNGSDEVTVDVAFDEAVTEPTAPTKLGHKFLGWFRLDGTTEWDFDNALCDVLTRESLTLTAHWEAKKYDVVFKPENGEADITVENITFGTVIPTEDIPADPEKTGYTFDGWFIDATTQWVSTSKLTTEGLVLTAHWDANEYDVKFDVNGGTPAVSTKHVKFGNKVPAPATAPTKKGYTLDGWYTAADVKWDFVNDTLQTADDITLTAKWIAKDVTLKYVDAYGTDDYTVYSTTIVKYDSKLTAPSDPEKTGYTFQHWHKLDRETIWNFEDDVVSQEPTLILEAHWQAKTYSITFVMGDKASLATGEYKYTYGEAYTLPSGNKVTVTEKGYSFVGWYDNADFTGTACTTVAVGTIGEKTYYALVSKNAFVEFTFDLNYEGAEEIKDNVVQGTPATERTVTRTGYKFLGWYKAPSGGDEYDFTQDVMSKTTVYAHWEALSYKVTFDAQNGTTPTTETFTSEQAITAIANPTKEGHTFEHWYVSDGDEDAAYEFGNAPTKNITLKAKWKLTEYSVTFNNNGQTSERKVEYSKTITKPNDPTLTGYTFKGWYKDAEYKQKWIFTSTETETADTMPARNITLYAKWDINKYTVSFNVNGGEGSVVNQMIEHGKKASAPTETITKEGYHLTGWKLNNGTVWNFATDTVTRNTVLTAVWEINTYTVTFNTAGGTAVEPVMVDHGDTIEQPTTTREGWTFVQWNDENGQPYDFTKEVTESFTLTAQWNGSVGTYLYCSSDGTTWSAAYTAVAHVNSQGKNEWKISGVELYKGMQFIVVTYAENSDTWLHAAATINQWTFTNALTIESVKSGNNYNFKVTDYSSTYAGATWTLYVCNISGSTASGISLEMEFVNELRDPTGTGKTVTAAEEATADVYIRGNFTNEFGLCDAWSSDSTLIKVLQSGDVYTFRKVQLKKGDAFKIYLSGMVVGETDNGWFGGTFAGLNTEFALTNVNGADVFLGSITTGYYDIVFNKQSKTLKVVPYAPPTVATVTVTPPSKVSYWKGEPFSDAGMVVKYTDTDGETYTVKKGNYEISSTATNVVGTKNITVTYGEKTAKFAITVKELKVTFVTNCGATVEAQSLSYGDKATTPSVTNTGYDFGGWFDNEGLTGTAYDFDTAVNAPLTLYAKWTIHKYNVTFKNGDTVLATLQVEYNTKIPADDVPTATKTGYDFTGWKNGTADYDLNAKVTKDLTLTADFTIQRYDIVLDYNYGVNNTDTKKVSYNGKLTAPSADLTTRTGYTFLGWFKDEETTAYDFDTLVTGPFTLTAQWETIEYTITYHLEGTIGGEAVEATLSGEKTKYTIESETFTLVKPTVTTAGVKFLNWRKGSATGTVITQVVKGATGDIDVYAEYTQNATVTFTFNLNYTGATNETQDVVSGLAASAIDDPTRVGYTFGGWYTEATGGEEYDFDTAVTEDTEIYAHWTINSHSVEFNTLGGSTVASQTKDYGSLVDEPADPTRAGWDFKGWYKENSYKTAWDFETDTVPDSDITLYAKWEKQTFTVTFKDGTKVLTTLTKTGVEYNTVISKPTDPKKDGYTFNGWLDEDGNTWKFGAEGDKVTSDITLTADWSENSYNISYTLTTGATHSNPLTYKVTDGEVTLTPASLTGYDFKGWFTSADYATGTAISTISIDCFDGLANGATLPIYAKLEIIKYTVTFDANEGTLADGTQDEITVNYGGTVTKPADPTRTGYKFTGWNNGDSAYTFGTTVTSNLTLVAQWQQVSIPEGAVEVTASKPYLVGKFGDCDVTTDYGYPTTAAGKDFDGVTDQYKVERVLAVGDLVTIRYGLGATDFNCALQNDAGAKQGVEFESDTVTENGVEFLKVKKAGTYTFYFKVKKEGTNTYRWSYVGFVEGGNSGEVTLAIGRYLVLGDAQPTANDKFETLTPVTSENMTEQYKIEFELSAETAIKIWNQTSTSGGSNIKINQVKINNGSDLYNNQSGTESYTLSKGKYTLYYKVYTNWVRLDFTMETVIEDLVVDIPANAGSTTATFKDGSVTIYLKKGNNWVTQAQMSNYNLYMWIEGGLKDTNYFGSWSGGNMKNALTVSNMNEATVAGASFIINWSGGQTDNLSGMKANGIYLITIDSNKVEKITPAA